MPKSRIESQRDMRGDLVRTLSRELLGPFDGPDEALPQRPTSRYVLGRLAPAGTQVSPEEDEGAADAATEDDNLDTGYASPISMAMNPSSIGVSFTVGPEVGEVEVTAEWGRYVKESRETERNDGSRGESTVWARSQHTEVFGVAVGDSGIQDLAGDVQVQWLCRTLPDGRRRAVSVFLVNRASPMNSGKPDDSEWLFQPGLSVRHHDNAAVFEARALGDVASFELLDADRRADELLFRDRPEYAVGHGCAAGWDADGGTGATVIRTVVLPVHELPRIDPRGDDGLGLDMRLLGGTGPEGVSGEQLRRMLYPLAESYGRWIDELSGRVSLLQGDLRVQADEHLDACRLVHERIVEGVTLLSRADDETSQLARSAFCFANRAMALQRIRSEMALRRRRAEASSPDVVPTLWRPFQLAFILINLPSLVDRSHPSRSTCDLLWFPTGGGKTEAYLGLTAFVLAHRRIRTPAPGYRAAGGVGVLMRYTLRLLTVQQFQRAAALACACEFLRASEAVWGDEPFSVGVWVGTSATPNQYSNPNGYWGDGAKEALQKWRAGEKPNGGTPAQLLNCPWCGARLGPSEYDADDYQQRINIYCSDDDCAFSPANDYGLDGIPAHTVDEQIYRHLPSLIIATVDKFAQMAWNGRIQSLFGRVQQYCERHGYVSSADADHQMRRHKADRARRWPAVEIVDVEPFEPPDLVIQDELHLISGPLGTLVGLYETAVDALGSLRINSQVHPPKVVASTATIRRADRQVGSLFDRSLMVFPPSGLDASDSWFGAEVPPEEAPGRLYLGVFAPGKSVKTALVRVYATLLSRAKHLHQADPQAADAYMTLVGYFNSLRELGGAVRLAEDDIPGRIGVLSRLPGEEFRDRLLYERRELTSNKTAEEIPEILGLLEQPFPPGKPPAGKYPVDVLFASSMISVGVDIDRLGLMVVNGQPKATAEYIQATSRVGRQPPGLVVTVYNWTRPRDISHYERFRSYHTGLYRYVEPTSVTPFSSRARDKGLAGVFAALVRLGDARMAPEDAAGNFDPADDWVRQAVKMIVDRASSIVGPQRADDSLAELRGLIDQWEHMASSPLRWSKRGTNASDSRWLIDGQEDADRRGVFVAPGSLREIEAEVAVRLIDPTGATT